MSKKINDYQMCGLVILSLLGVVSYTSGMHTVKLPPGVAQRLSKPYPSDAGKKIAAAQAAVEKRKKEEPSAVELVANESEKEKLIEENIKKSMARIAPFGEVYLYNQNTGDGAILKKELWQMSPTLRNMMFDLGQTDEKDIESQSLPTDFPTSVIKKGGEILKNIPSSKENKIDEQSYTNILKPHIEKLGFDESVQLLIFANHFGFSKAIINSLIEKIQSKTDLFFDNRQQLTDGDLEILQSMDKALLKEIIGVKWYILLQKIKFFMAKNSKDTESKKQGA